VFVSAASGWEIAIKAALGRLRLAAPPEQFVPEHVRLNAFRPLAISLAHALAVHGLPDHHRDPFDRILAAQARAEGLTMVSVDPLLRAYDVEIVW
jgi:PIN domain nuclease of toxin-antitoxin system